MLTQSDIEKLAQLCRLALSPQEKTKLLGEIDSILGYVSEIQNITGKEGAVPVSSVQNVMRADENPHEPGAYTEAILKQAPQSLDGYIQVKKILSQD